MAQHEWDLPKTAKEIVEYLRECACVCPIHGCGRMPTEMDDKVFDLAAAEIERLREALAELLQVQDGLPMTGIEATRRADYARAALTQRAPIKPLDPTPLSSYRIDDFRDE